MITVCDSNGLWQIFSHSEPHLQVLELVIEIEGPWCSTGAQAQGQALG